MRNGAGKTITVRILAPLLRPDGGRVAVLGHDVVREAGNLRPGGRGREAGKDVAPAGCAVA